MRPAERVALVIGFGNEWRGDDGVGPEVAKRVGDMNLPGVTSVAVHQLMPELAEPLSQARWACFVDASAEARGEAIVVSALVPEHAASPFSHAFEPRGLLALSEALYRRAPRACLISIRATQFTPGTPLSAEAESRAEVAVRQIVSLIQHEMGPR